MATEAELKRQDSGGTLQPWVLVADADNTETSLSDPVVEHALRAAIGAIADAEAASGNGTLVALLKNLRTRLAALETGQQSDALTDAQLRATPVKVDDDATQALLTTIDTVLDTLAGKVPDQEGTWSYYAGTAGTVNVTGRVLQVTAIALEAAASFTINGGDTITIPYGTTDKVSTALTVEPKGNLVDPTVIFTGTTAYFIEVVV